MVTTRGGGTSAVPTYLDNILAHHRDRARADTRPMEELREHALRVAPVRGFAAALAGDGISVIAEVKRRSPSRGDLCPDLDPGECAREYAVGGASCMSVLTDGAFFGGSADDLRVARGATDLPVLRKDFTVCPADVLDARAMGADAVLLIVAALDDRELHDLIDLSTEIGLDALVEAHDAAEIERACVAGATLVGVNQRDLTRFTVDTSLALRLAPGIPQEVIGIAESGITSPEDIAALAAAGYRGALVGESVVTAPDRAKAVRTLVEAGGGRR